MKILDNEFTDERELRKLGEKLGKLHGEMVISDGDLAFALAVYPLVEGWLRGHGESSAVIVANMEWEQFRRYVSARQDADKARGKSAG